MKALRVILLSFLLTLSLPALGQQSPPWCFGDETVYGGAASPSVSQSSTWITNSAAIAGGYGVGYDSTFYYCGQSEISGTTNVDAVYWVLSANGTITGFDYVCKIFELSGSNLGSLLGTSDTVQGAAWSDTVVVFTFASPVSLSGGNYALVLERTDGTSSSNYAIVRYSAGSGDLVGRRTHFSSAGVNSSFGDEDCNIGVTAQ